MARPEALLFDLDGTLIDSAPDLAGAANEQRAAHGLPPVPYEDLRRMVGSGARGMIGVAFGLSPGAAGYDALRDDFLHRYRQRLLHSTALFGEMHAVLDHLDDRALRWGIVTNKALHMAEPIADGLGLRPRAAVLIGGDSTPFTKPHPEPLLEAARRMGLRPERCAYVGDDVRDIRAGRAAGMLTLAAAWGYLGDAEPVEHWGADAVLPSPLSLLNWLELA
jgi:N-acetyl-D-muramate 6-phosphate phosphatase